MMLENWLKYEFLQMNKNEISLKIMKKTIADKIEITIKVMIEKQYDKR